MSAKPNTTDWKSINLKKTKRHVTNLQRRIYLASKNGDKKKVRDLQRQLVRSYSATVQAVHRVTVINKGKLTPGIDGFKATNDKQRGMLVDKILSENIKKHRPKPAYRTYIPKKNGKMRSLGIPTIKDRVYQEILRLALEPEWEAKFEPTSYGFRPKRRQHDAIQRIYYNIRSGNWCWIFEGDFKSCFDTLSHDFILKQLKGFPYINVIKRFLEAGYVDNGVFNETEEGTPQGGLLSPLLANIALHGMEQALNVSYRKTTATNKKGEKTETFVSQGKYRCVRFADDFVIFAKSKKDIMKVYKLLEPYLNERGLILAEDKTRITKLSDGFNFLGFNCRRYKDRVSRIKPSKESIKKFKEKLDGIFKSTHGDNVDTLIFRLIPVIRGTALYWRHSVIYDVFSDMDNYLWNKIYKFLRRMHPNKNWKWIKNRYFIYYRDDYGHESNWVLSDPKSGKFLMKMSWFKYREYVMIKHDYSPYDRTKIDYFKNRKDNYYF
ncbi:MAG: group II intron reverse transcriptase/maturase [Bacilli bacterium]|nr:group II intron reverse transcriptase/maturase [Bacilli bacterium]